MRRIMAAAVALACLTFLSACSFLPPHSVKFGDNDDKAVQDMQHIAGAVKSHDAAALKKLFSVRALENATDLDSGLDYFLSVFPSGHMTWKLVGFSTSGKSELSKKTEEVFSAYKVSVGGQQYLLFFVDYTLNQLDDPRNVGLYALGVTQYTTKTTTGSGATKPFFAWEKTFGMNPPKPSGKPGVYVPQN